MTQDHTHAAPAPNWLHPASDSFDTKPQVNAGGAADAHPSPFDLPAKPDRTTTGRALDRDLDERELRSYATRFLIGWTIVVAVLLLGAALERGWIGG